VIAGVKPPRKLPKGASPKIGGIKKGGK